MYADEGLRLVVLPKCIEIATGLKRPKLQDRLGPYQSPASTGTIHAIFDQWRQAPSMIPVAIGNPLLQEGIYMRNGVNFQRPSLEAVIRFKAKVFGRNVFRCRSKAESHGNSLTYLTDGGTSSFSVFGKTVGLRRASAQKLLLCDQATDFGKLDSDFRQIL
jgi:hypothetical protein